ncbi:MAG: hypothetical protein ACKO3P_20885 [Planctomycetaceae bacterium]
MVATSRSKPVDKSEVLRRLTALLKRTYPGPTPRKDLPVLETLLFAVCLEDATVEQAEVAYQHLLKSFPDLNEARVSSITELQQVMANQSDPAWRALRVKSLLQHSFDAHYAFELEGLKRKTSELAIKSLGKIPSLSWFVRGYGLQQALESHALPLDSRMLGVLVWLALVEPETGAEEAAEQLRSHVRKSDAPLLIHLLRSLAHDPRRNRVFQPTAKGIDCAATADEGLHRLEVLMSKGPASVPKAQPRPLPPPSKTGKGAVEKAAAEKLAADKLAAEKGTPDKAGPDRGGHDKVAPGKGPAKAEGGAAARSASAAEAALNGAKKVALGKGPEKHPAQRPPVDRLAVEAGKGTAGKGGVRPVSPPEAGRKGLSGKPLPGKGTVGKPAPSKSSAATRPVLAAKTATKSPPTRKEPGKSTAAGAKGKGGAQRASVPGKSAAKSASSRASTGKATTGAKHPPKRG